jgi:cytochrome c oxidase accessory protein FixG
LTTPSIQPDSYYEAHRKIYPREVAGRFQQLRVLAAWVLLGLFYLVPWLDWDGRQAVLFDLPERRFYVFGLVFWPQDFFYLTWLLIILGLSLFFFTALAGRLWCGYACPQTVWTEVFLWVERRFEGDRNRRIKLDAAPWHLDKLWRKAGKHLSWLLLAAWTGFTFVGFFVPVEALAMKLWTFTAGGWETFWVLFYGFATWGNAGFMREQVCKYMCPYARFQSAMFDHDTLVIAYDTRRGEPRGNRPRQADHRAAGLGDCIDCKACVQACPTGIDIRDGLQYECIACAACVDACDAVMDRMGYQKGLVRYTSERGLEGAAARILRPRVIVYACLLGLLTAGLATALLTRNPLGLEVLRDRNALYRTLSDGSIENVYTVRILNKDTEAHRMLIAAAGLPGLEMDDGTAGSGHSVAAGEARAVPVRVRLPAGAVHGSVAIEFTVTPADDPNRQVAHEARFLAP